MRMRQRGPECSTFTVIGDSAMIGFHRLAIMDPSPGGNQPFTDAGGYCICNGEIYGYEQIKQEYNIVTHGHSDCEIILPLYRKVGIDKMVHILGSEFAFLILDGDRIIAGRDPLGCRPLFYAIYDHCIIFSSEVKGLLNSSRKSIHIFPPGYYGIVERDGDTLSQLTLHQYYTYIYTEITLVPSIDEIHGEIRNRFINCVKKRLDSQRPFGALLSGGLDSSLVVAVARMLTGRPFPVFTVALSTGSTDLPYAKMVAEYCDVQHHIIECPPETALCEIECAIFIMETYDITTVRAGTIQRMAAKYISEETDIKCILVGENSDEIFQGYKYYHNQPDPQSGHMDSVSRVRDVHMFDGLRTDRVMAGCGLEVRMPFADPELVDYVLSLPPMLVMPRDGKEKTLLRDAFRPLKILPDAVLYRSKEALSDGCSGEKSWYEYCREYTETQTSRIQSVSYQYEFNPPISKEAKFYRDIFSTLFPDEAAQLIPYYWMPRWSPETGDPSARTLSVYKQ